MEKERKLQNSEKSTTHLHPLDRDVWPQTSRVSNTRSWSQMNTSKREMLIVLLTRLFVSSLISSLHRRHLSRSQTTSLPLSLNCFGAFSYIYD